MSNYYNEFYKNSFAKNDIKLLIVLKKLWFSQVNNKKNREIDLTLNVDRTAYLYLKWEYYLRKGNFFIPVKRVDTVINGVTFLSEEKHKSSVYSNEKILKFIFDGMLEIFDFSKAVLDIDKLPKKSWNQIQEYNNSYFDMPILKDSVVRKGLYLTFDEFKKNKPSIVDFKERHNIEDKNGNRIMNFWGYCMDGEVRIGKNSSELLFRKNNTFEFSKYNNNRIMFPYQLDMETGNIY